MAGAFRAKKGPAMVLPHVLGRFSSFTSSVFPVPSALYGVKESGVCLQLPCERTSAGPGWQASFRFPRATRNLNNEPVMVVSLRRTHCCCARGQAQESYASLFWASLKQALFCFCLARVGGARGPWGDRLEKVRAPTEGTPDARQPARRCLIPILEVQSLLACARGS